MFGFLATAITPSESISDLIEMAGIIITFLTTSPLALFFWAPVVGIVIGIAKKGKRA